VSALAAANAHAAEAAEAGRRGNRELRRLLLRLRRRLLRLLLRLLRRLLRLLLRAWRPCVGRRRALGGAACDVGVPASAGVRRGVARAGTGTPTAAAMRVGSACAQASAACKRWANSTRPEVKRASCKSNFTRASSTTC
jgi:hypothetical protein